MSLIFPKKKGGRIRYRFKNKNVYMTDTSGRISKTFKKLLRTK